MNNNNKIIMISYRLRELANEVSKIESELNNELTLEEQLTMKSMYKNFCDGSSALFDAARALERINNA